MQNFRISYIFAGLISAITLILVLNFILGALTRGEFYDITLIEDNRNTNEENSGITPVVAAITNIQLVEEDYFFAIPRGTYANNYQVFFDPWREVEEEEVPQEVVVRRGPRSTRDLKYLGTLSQGGEVAYSFRDNQLEAAGIFTLGTEWRGWTLKEVRENDFLFTKNDEEYIVQR